MRPWKWISAAVAIGLLTVVALTLLTPGAQGLAGLGGGQAVPVFVYRPIDADSIELISTGGEGQWTRVTTVIEDEHQVSVTILALRWPGTSTHIGTEIVFTVDLQRPLGNRIVHDGLHEVLREIR